MNILGLSCFYHDSAAALLRDGDLVAAAHEERFTRKRHDPDVPKRAVEYCLAEAGMKMEDVDYVVFYDKPFVKFERILITYLATFPRSLPSFSKAIPVWLKEKLWVPRVLERELGYENKELLFVEHHQSHAASAFLPSPYEEAAILTLDGVGEWATATQGVGRGNELELIREIRFPHSLGLLYSAFTYYLGFKVNSAEYKVMGAAPYGKPKYYDKILEHLVDLREDGSFKLNMKYFAYDYGLTMTNDAFAKLFGQPVRDAESKMEDFHWDMAASVQKVTEEIVLRIVRDLHARTGMKNLVMAGGVALNCVANGRVIREGPFENLWVQPAAGDAGGALGAAMYAHHCVLKQPRKFRMDHAYWGPAFSDDEIRRYLDARKAPYKTYSRDEMIRETARRLDEEQAVVGWFQGRMEWGPRSLGSRSIIADSRNQENWTRVNLKIKFRESFRPFAPAVLREKAGDWFDLDRESPYMLLVCQVRDDVRKDRPIPSVTHVDGSARVQTVTRDQHAEFYDLLQAFDQRSGCPVLINTSFNVRGEPIVCTPEDAYLCFMRTNMDVLVLGNQILDKRDQPELVEDFDWRERYALD
jgi:carbamoyltransferase